MTWRRREEILVFLVALHSLAIGLLLVFATSWGTRFAGWPQVLPLFFPRQGGAFHFVVAAGYWMEYRRHRTVSLLLVAKAIATVFLVAAAVLEPGAWSVPLSAAADAGMGALVWGVHRKAVRESVG